ncbi:pseudouridine synthase [Mycoplasmopsis gallinacea]|uniref:Pseudouridine synthase n=1 Tax=Mycoplasmopsis gallinacea TaxID=29556 RepID=A0A449A430_9BACT|nr:pseudouridine synthase [Mycoplasmopsis gallinacea]VEU58964.1 Pseudouridine synthase [Mycoplasmopsis gallinacea]
MNKIRIDKLVSSCLNLSRAEAKKLISKKKILVNNVSIAQSSYIIDLDKDEVLYENQKLLYQEFFYFVLNKPSGYICSWNSDEGAIIFDLLDRKDQAIKDLNTFGRLDKDTTGIIILSNDGKLNHELFSGKKHVDKTYLATLDKSVNIDDLLILEKGIDIGDGEFTKECKAIKINNNLVQLTISEGKYHQVKRMFKAIGYEVIKLHRSAIGNMNLIDLNILEGKYIQLTKEQVLSLIG